MTYPEQLRRLADWLEANNVHDDQILSAGIDIGANARIVVSEHSILRAVFPGKAAKAERGQCHDKLSLVDGGVKFEAWQRREDKPVESELVVL